MRADRLAAVILTLALTPLQPAAGEGPGAERHPAETVVRELTRAIDFFDLEAFVAGFHEDITMFYPIDSIAGRVDGLDALAATQERVFARLGERFGAAGRTEGPYFGLVPLDLEVQELPGGEAAVVTWHVDRGTHLGRRTAVVEARHGVWKIASYHASNVTRPESEAKPARAAGD